VADRDPGEQHGVFDLDAVADPGVGVDDRCTGIR
jgi:hypothetical protein